MDGDMQPRQPARSSVTDVGMGTPTWVGKRGPVSSTGSPRLTLPASTTSLAVMLCSIVMT